MEKKNVKRKSVRLIRTKTLGTFGNGINFKFCDERNLFITSLSLDFNVLGKPRITLFSTEVEILDCDEPELSKIIDWI